MHNKHTQIYTCTHIYVYIYIYIYIPRIESSSGCDATHLLPPLRIFLEGGHIRQRVRVQLQERSVFSSWKLCTWMMFFFFSAEFFRGKKRPPFLWVWLTKRMVCCWWFRNPACKPVEVVVYPIIYRDLYIPGGCLGFLNHQQYCSWILISNKMDHQLFPRDIHQEFWGSFSGPQWWKWTS